VCTCWGVYREEEERNEPVHPLPIRPSECHHTTPPILDLFRFEKISNKKLGK
jgi:hypothetical protein